MGRTTTRSTSTLPPRTKPPKTTSPGGQNNEGWLLDPQVQKYLKDCEKSVATPTSAQLTYPSTLSLRYGQSVTYRASVDMQSTPASVPPDTQFEKDTGEKIVVACQLAMRLVNVGQATEVVDPDSNAGGWLLHHFDAGGVLDWSWTVNAVGVGSGQLRLEMVPAAVEGTTILDLQDSSLSRVTQVTVGGNSIETAQSWLSRDTGPIKNVWLAIIGVAAAVGTAYGTVTAWMKKHAVKWPWSRRPPPSKPQRKAKPKPKKKTTSP
jgi:hypothetical protein